MDDQVHPRRLPVPTSGTCEIEERALLSEASSKPTSPEPGTYIIRISRDQILCNPPPENTCRSRNHTRKGRHRRRCCRCLCWTLCVIFLLFILKVVVAHVFKLICRPRAPDYYIQNIAIRSLDLKSSAPISPEFDVTLRIQNPNDKLGIYYQKGSSMNFHYNGIKLCDGVLPEFYQASNNLTVFETTLSGDGIALPSATRSALLNQQQQKKVLLGFSLKSLVKIKFGYVTTWKIVFKVNCDLVVDSLTKESKMVSEDCHSRMQLW
ncbi:hypothetical protein RJ639_047381 [Escallonia herrerae]|uniref:Late embryogenesis abundant protein LEA-2 subgroup domain-containing protein n=1 Tax=Escallonia herrerae TaxID=1293975 RepID=A0AA88W872_9ASTE|nr:hypothetical protein RJ639_047381 [Escallonia herrerae]